MVDSLANRMPDLSKRELPACLTFQKIYEMYTESVQNPLKPSQFRRMRLNKFPDVIIPKVDRFGYFIRLKIILINFEVYYSFQIC